LHKPRGLLVIKYEKDEVKDILLDNGFVVWKWGEGENENKLEGHLKKEDCRNIIGIKQDCFIAALIDSNEARFAAEKRFNNEVQGHEKQLHIERLIFSEDRDKIFKNGKLVFFETIISLDKVVKYLQEKE